MDKSESVQKDAQTQTQTHRHTRMGVHCREWSRKFDANESVDLWKKTPVSVYLLQEVFMRPLHTAVYLG